MPVFSVVLRLLGTKIIIKRLRKNTVSIFTYSATPPSYRLWPDVGRCSNNKTNDRRHTHTLAGTTRGQLNASRRSIYPYYIYSVIGVYVVWARCDAKGSRSFFDCCSPFVFVARRNDSTEPIQRNTTARVQVRPEIQKRNMCRLPVV